MGIWTLYNGFSCKTDRSHGRRVVFDLAMGILDNNARGPSHYR